jgi:alpha-mannosidase
MILNMYIGHQFLRKEFNVVPKIGWMLDAFGHSATNARLFSEFGFEAIFFARLDDKDREERLKT